MLDARNGIVSTCCAASHANRRCLAVLSPASHRLPSPSACSERMDRTLRPLQPAWPLNTCHVSCCTRSERWSCSPLLSPWWVPAAMEPPRSSRTLTSSGSRQTRATCRRRTTSAMPTSWVRTCQYASTPSRWTTSRCRASLASSTPPSPPTSGYFLEACAAGTLRTPTISPPKASHRWTPTLVVQPMRPISIPGCVSSSTRRAALAMWTTSCSPTPPDLRFVGPRPSCSTRSLRQHRTWLMQWTPFVTWWASGHSWTALSTPSRSCSSKDSL
mmetsp:Transcript_13779/g.44095  ORF Transcript_13779/g.44095 Transcript_13779/m.44095 type:complete len:272 (+) Transcript_13779:1512-2327(+)